MINDLQLVNQPNLPDTTKKLKWLERADLLKPKLHHNIRKPVGEVQIVADLRAWQGWKAVSVVGVEDYELRLLGGGDVVDLDFGQHIVGKISFELTTADEFKSKAIESPVRLRIIFAEMPIELGENPTKYRDKQTLSWNWYQDEYVTADKVPCKVKLPRRHAFRYVRFEIVDKPDTAKKFCMRNVEVQTSSTVSQIIPPSRRQLPDDLDKIDTVGVRTLRNCMQTVFEDGPKRDRRLWLGDLRLQMLTNQVSYKNKELAERCLLFFAALSDRKGMIPACVYEAPKPQSGGSFILDYSLLFSGILLDYYKSGGDLELIREFWPLLTSQTNYALKYLDSSHVFQIPDDVWIFVDWNDDLHKQSAMHCILLYVLRCNQRLAQLLSLPEAEWMRLIEYLNNAGRKAFWDDATESVYSGPEKQKSYAAWAWAVIGRMINTKEAQAAYGNLHNDPDCIHPNTPYLMHYVVEALIVCGMQEEAINVIREYWGGMIERGASTFWEIYNPQQPLLSPYNNPQINSYCHAWSCTPAYYLRSSLLDI